MLVRVAIVLALAALPAIATSASDATTSAGERVDAGAFSIVRPDGSGWKTRKESVGRSGKQAGGPAEPGIVFERRLDGPPPCLSSVTRIVAARNLTLGEKSKLAEQEVAKDYREMELTGLVFGGQFGQVYAVTASETGEIRHGDRTLYFFRYRTVWAQTRKDRRQLVQDAVLYLYFPPQFASDRFFYQFVIDKACVATDPRNFPTQSMDEVFPIIDSLQIKSR